MNATTSADLEMLLAGCVWPGRFDARDLPSAFEHVIAALADAKASYAVAGRLALARYCRAQCTDLIEIRLGSAVASPSLAHSSGLKVAAPLSKGSTVRLRFASTPSSTEQRFIECSTPERWLGADANMATAEHLLWLALSSDAPEADTDAVSLIQSGRVDWNAFGTLSRPYEATFAERLVAAKEIAERTATSTYSASVERRLQAGTPHRSLRRGAVSR